MKENEKEELLNCLEIIKGYINNRNICIASIEIESLINYYQLMKITKEEK